MYLLLDFCDTNKYGSLIYYIQKEDIKIENLKSFKNTKLEEEKRKYVASLWSKML